MEPADDQGDGIDRFTDQLDSFAASLTADERRALEVLVLQAMDPVSRARFLTRARFTDDEEAFLVTLDDAVGEH